jgi:UDP-N-acetylglucosamine diphosphorylase / glucose-1-phosphate thymidylyltransferase / UDP-N-acetylgalactosamine diphosphorylase / glucosamine-1-phosphate N-acetyltransferase / galactosamine-1-phosphate N-acetyltransferase
VVAEAVVMAAGEGRRLRPLSERWPKPVLPIDGRPVLATLLRELAAAGIERAWVVVGHLAEQVEELVGDGAAWDLDARIASQPEPLGSADAVWRALEAGARPPLLVTGADTVFTQGDLARAAAAWTADQTGALGVRPSNDPEKTPVRVLNGRIVALGEGDGLTGAPLWLLGDELAAALGTLPGPPHELGRAFADAIERGRTILALELGPTRDLTHPSDLVTENFPYLWR